LRQNGEFSLICINSLTAFVDHPKAVAEAPSF